jgi:hypothetical protein
MTGVSNGTGEQLSGIHKVHRWWRQLLYVVSGAVLLAGAGVGLRAHLRASDIAEVHSAVFDIRSAAIAWQIDHGDSTCPNMKQLIGGKYLTSFTRMVDNWDRPFVITCYQMTVAVASTGPDRAKGTTDDIVAPPAPLLKVPR